MLSRVFDSMDNQCSEIKRFRLVPGPPERFLLVFLDIRSVDVMNGSLRA
jgi:hypothetical protein